MDDLSQAIINNKKHLWNIILKYSCVLAIASAIIYILTAYHAILNDNNNLDFGEGAVAYESWLLANGKNIYFHYLHTSNLVLINPYPPLFQFISSLLIRIGLSPLSAGRIVSIVSTLLTVVIGYYLLKEFKVEKLVSMTISLSILSLTYVFAWSVLDRVDMLGIMFTLLALFMIFKTKYTLSFIFMSLALLSKQSFIALPFAVFVYFVTRREYLETLKLLVILIFPQILLSLIIPYYFENVVLANIYQHLNFDVFYRGIRIIVQNWALISLAIFFVLMISISSVADYRYRIMAGYFLISLLVSIFSYSKPGSSINYFIEPLISGLLLVGLSFNVFNSDDLRLLLSVLLFGMLFNLVLINNSISTLYQIKLDYNYTPLYNKLATLNGSIFSENPFLALKTQKGPVVDLFLLTRLYYSGVWNQSAFLSNISSRRFSVIVTLSRLEGYSTSRPDSRYTKQMIRDILCFYKFNASFGKYYIYTPKTNTTIGVCNESGS